MPKGCEKMNYQEFMQIAGYEVSYETYKNIIEPMYMTTDIIDKKEFCKCFSKKLFAIKPTDKLVKELRDMAKDLQYAAKYGLYVGDKMTEFKKLCSDYQKRQYNNLDYYFEYANDSYYSYTSHTYRKVCERDYIKSLVITHKDGYKTTLDLIF